MNKKKFLALLLVMALLITCFAGCTGGDETDQPGTTGGDEGNTELTAEEAAAELYAMLPETCLSGLFDPNGLKDRSSEDKALPFTPKDPKNVVIGWSEQTAGDPWFVSVGDSAKHWAEEYGYTLYFDIADFELSKQSAHIDSYISRGVDIIVVDPVDVKGVAADIQRAVDAGIPVIGFGSEIFGAPVITTVCSNLFLSGMYAGEYAATLYDADEQVNTGIVIGIMGNSTAETRVNGIMTGFIKGRAEARGIDYTVEQAALDATKLFNDLRKTGKFSSDKWNFACVGSGEGNWTFEGGIDVAEPIIAANADKLNMFIGENDFQGLGAAQALQNYGIADKVNIICPGNGMKSELEKVKDGTLAANGSHDGWAFARETMKMIKDLADGTNTYDANNLPTLTTFKSFPLNPTTIDTYWDDNPNNLYHKNADLEILEVPQLIEKIKSGEFYEPWVPAADYEFQG